MSSETGTGRNSGSEPKALDLGVRPVPVGADSAAGSEPKALDLGALDVPVGADSAAGSEPKALDLGALDVPVGATAKDPKGPESEHHAGHKPRAVRPVTKEPPVAFRPRPGTRAQLEKRAGDRALSVVVEAAVDAYLGRKVREVDPGLRAALADELSPIGGQLAAIAVKEAGIGNNLNQQARFINTYLELPNSYGEDLAALTASHEAVLAELRTIRSTLESLVAAR